MIESAQVPALVVDDDIVIRHMLVLQLNKLGVKADTAANGIEAMHRIRDWQYEIIFMDIQMPEMDGLQTTASIRVLGKEKNLKPVVIIGISAGITTKDTALEVGMNDFMAKPLRLEHLEGALTQWLPERS